MSFTSYYQRTPLTDTLANYSYLPMMRLTRVKWGLRWATDEELAKSSCYFGPSCSVINRGTNKVHGKESSSRCSFVLRFFLRTSAENRSWLPTKFASSKFAIKRMYLLALILNRASCFAAELQQHVFSSVRTKTECSKKEAKAKASLSHSCTYYARRRWKRRRVICFLTAFRAFKSRSRAAFNNFFPADKHCFLISWAFLICITKDVTFLPFTFYSVSFLFTGSRRLIHFSDPGIVLCFPFIPAFFPCVNIYVHIRVHSSSLHFAFSVLLLGVSKKENSFLQR